MNRRQTESKVCSQNLCRGANRRTQQEQREFTHYALQEGGSPKGNLEKNKRHAVKKFFLYTLCTLAVALTAVACNDGLDISGDYGFSVEHLPVQKRIVRGETAEIRLQLVREGRWDDAKYQMRWFQPDGKGRLSDELGQVFAPNDLYDLERETFRFYYTSLSDDQQKIDLYFIDSHGKVFPLSFTFNSETKEEE